MGYNPETYYPRRLEIMVRRLRSKMKAHFVTEFPLETVHGRGYTFTGLIRLAD
ncbi:MAG: helix-turn-helix domain-containing protein [Methylococcales bacterium]